MRKIIPFKKELSFKTKVSDVTSISLEHTINLDEVGIISGKFMISGDYKMTSGSINKEPFNYEVPFDIAVDPRINMESVKVDIDDFYYEVINNEKLQVNIDIVIDAEDIIIPKEEVQVEETKEEERCYDKDEEIIPSVTYEKKEKIDISNVIDDVIDIDVFENIDNKETFVTYKVYVVKQGDNIDDILVKYGITKEELCNYNDVTDIKVGDKLIIPASNNE